MLSINIRQISGGCDRETKADAAGQYTRIKGENSWKKVNGKA